MKGKSRSYMSFIRSGLLLIVMVFAMAALPGFSAKALAAEYPDYLSFTAVDGDVTIGMKKVGIPDDYVLEYTADLLDWTRVTLTETNERICTIPSGEIYYFRTDGEKEALAGWFGDIISGEYTLSNWTFVMSGAGKVKAAGNIMSLLDPSCKKTSVGDFCFYHLFDDCSSLMTAPKLPAMELGRECYLSMFRNCTALEIAPELPAEELKQSCYSSMFGNCTSLTTAPELPAERLATNCYSEMFSGCAALTKAPKLPAESLEWGCYQHMFDRCVSLVEAPELPAQSLAPFCYNGMFSRCSRLEAAPVLPAKTLVEGCYYDMFLGCNKLDELTVSFVGTDGTPIGECLEYWLVSTYAAGTLYCPESTLQFTDEELFLFCDWRKKAITGQPSYLSFAAVDGDVVIGMSKVRYPEEYVLEYTADFRNWTEITLTETNKDILTIHEGETYYFRTNRERDSISKAIEDAEGYPIPSYWRFVMSGEGKVEAAGNIMSLLDPTCEKTSVGDYAFYGLFSWCDKLSRAPRLPARTLGRYCYAQMFSDCSDLRLVANLPAEMMTEGCYKYMFANCTALTFSAELPAKTLDAYCYYGMFFGCGGVNYAFDLPAENLAEKCYMQMYSGCSLKTAPRLPALTLAEYCYSEMFAQCEQMEEAPELPAKTLVKGCYSMMFNGCKKLSSVVVGFTEAESSLDDCLANWLEGVSETGTLLCPESTLQYSNEELCFPAGWGKEDVKEQTRRQINSFVTRMYQQCLSRDPDQPGLEGWAEQLETDQMNGAQIAEQFVFSNEMLDKNLSDAEFVKVLYRSMMGREADEAGLNGWVSQLQGGFISRSEVTKAFVESAEFSGICTEYGITRGDFEAVGPIERFVTRFYTICLGRPADQKGHWGWVKQLQQKNLNGAQIAEAFFFSDEFVNKNVSDEVYIATLYRTILGREADETGLAGWVEQLQNNQMTRRDILGAFIESTEFTELCAGYGIERGSL